MAELNKFEKQPAAPAVPDKKRHKADVGLDEEADNVADFMEVMRIPFYHEPYAAEKMA